MPDFNFFNHPVFLLTSQERFTFISLWRLVDISQIAIRVAKILECDEQIANVCFSESGRVLRLVLFYCELSLAFSDWTSSWLSTFTICNTEQVSGTRLAVSEITYPAYRIVAPENMAICGFYKQKSSSFIIAGFVELLRCIELYFDWYLTESRLLILFLRLGN